ncbi:odorant receptor 13a [Drosophila persimilis]|uniref:odorant receptor 13a n=1 Tax=Drosophila persimilis TaxID=7234 RepID=UPI000F08BA34|nr:odorant receptor 13a [Drosophila persimilis]
MFNLQQYTAITFRLPVQCVWLKLNGSWPFVPSSRKDNSSMCSILYTAWAWYVIASVGITIGFQTAYLVTHLSDIIMTTENCCTTFMGALNFVRLLHLRFNQRKFRQLIEQFERDIWIPENTHISVNAECHKRMFTFTIMTGLLSCLICMYCALPLVEIFFRTGVDAVEKPFPYKMLFPYDPYSSWMRYVFTYMFTSYAGICVVTTLFAEDSIFGFFITYTCGQFRLLHERVDNVLTAAKERADEQHLQLQRLHNIVQQHNKIIRFAKCLEDFFNPILLVNLMISSLLICMVGFQIITGQNMFIGEYVKFIVYISSAISQLYVLCENGDALIIHSTNTARHLYGCDWENPDIRNFYSYTSMSHQFRNDLKFMILCSQRPVRITAFKFSTLSLQSFTAILSTSMSYFTLLRNLRKQDNSFISTER